jgi:hypothetical protein
MTTPKLTVALREQICGFILSGSYPHIAAEAAGVPREVFEDWMKRGGSPRSAKKYRLFREAVLKAQHQAQLTAESRTLSKDPLNRLKCGPGKETPTSPGWSNPGRGGAPKEGDNWLMHKENQELIEVLLRALEPYPEVRVAVSQALDQLEQSRQNQKQASGGRQPPVDDKTAG